MTETTPTLIPEEAVIEVSLRPQALADFVGHEHIKGALGRMLAAAQRRREPVDHILFHGPPGTGKTTLSWIIAREMGVSMRELSAPAIRRPGDLAAVLVSLARGQVLFLDEVHRLANEAAEMLYSGIEDFRISVVTGRGEDVSAVTLDLPRFTLVAATTEFGLLPPSPAKRWTCCGSGRTGWKPTT
jgi:Holliday junction DNA helicase RuvB